MTFLVQISACIEGNSLTGISWDDKVIMVITGPIAHVSATDACAMPVHPGMSRQCPGTLGVVPLCAAERQEVTPGISEQRLQTCMHLFVDSLLHHPLSSVL